MMYNIKLWKLQLKKKLGDKMDVPIFMMMCGLPASGKSTKAQELAKEYDATVFSSDAIRAEWYGDEAIQGDNNKLFIELHRRIKDCLRGGKSAIFDATNINYKKRISFLAELKNISCTKICVLMATPYEECVKRNVERERKVPEDVIKRMYFNFNIPYWYEGWDDIKIVYSENAAGYYGSLTDFIQDYENYDQHNSHHSLTLGEHCKQTNLLAQCSASGRNTCIAAVIHDCGKPDTAAFKDSKGNITTECHYYNHQYVGGYKALFFNYSGFVKTLDVSIRVMWHMMPYFWKEEKTQEKYRKLWGEELYADLMKLHEADKAAH